MSGKSGQRRLEWSPRADRDYFDAWAYIAQDNVEAADGVAKRIHDAARSLIFQPLLGRKGQRPGTREYGRPPFSLFRLDARVPDNFAPLLHLGFQKRREFLR